MEDDLTSLPLGNEDEIRDAIRIIAKLIIRQAGTNDSIAETLANLSTTADNLFSRVVALENRQTSST